ncbi:MAG: EAL domain-containing protein [Caulobacteraceae bacterium]|nr:EAL domain-containing protein [Caulobacteraceae bacterium]
MLHGEVAESAPGAPADLAFIDVSRGGDEMLRNALTSVRKHLGMDVAYISEIAEGSCALRDVDAPGLEAPIAASEIYCRHILEGHLPELMADTTAFELAQSLPITTSVPIGAHLGVPILGENGERLGVFGCLSLAANPALSDRELQVMRVFADVAATHVRRRMEGERHLKARRARFQSLIAEGAFSLAYQPIWDLGARRVMGFEALCRFAEDATSSPEPIFREAAELGCETELEVAVIRRAVETLSVLEDEFYLAVNASPGTVVSGALAALKGAVPLHRLVLELTEHDAVQDYAALDDALAPLRAEGLRIAIDDAGAGYASLRHIVRLKPDIVKLDMSLTRHVDADPSRQALASAMSIFCSKTHIVLVAEGIETWAELDTLRGLGVPTGQGFHLGRPTPLQAARRLARRADAALVIPELAGTAAALAPHALTAMASR